METKQERDGQEQLVVFILDKEEYASSVEAIQEVITIPEITPIPRSPNFISGVINLRGKVIPIVDLEKRFDLIRENKEMKPKNIIIVDEKEAPFGIIVDEVTEVLRVPSSSIQEAPASISSKLGGIYIKGVIVLEVNSQSPGQVVAPKSPEAPVVPAAIKAETTAPQKEGNNRVLLLLDVKKILSTDEKQIVKTAIPNEIQSVGVQT